MLRWIAGLLLLALLLPGLSPADPFAGRNDISGKLEEIRSVSYEQHWQKAQAMLDELAPDVDSWDLRDRVEFYLLEARHLALDDRSPEALALAADLLGQPLDDDHRLRVLQFCANIAVLLRDYELAFDYLRRALDIEAAVDDPVARNGTLNMAAYLYGRVGEHDRAIDYGERAVSLALESDRSVEECMARQRLAPVFKWADMEGRAEAAYRAGIETCERSGNALFVGVLRHGLADLLRQQGRFDEALEQVRLSIEILGNAAFPLGEYEARLVLAEVQADRGQLREDSDSELNRLAAYFQERDLWDQLARLEDLRANLALERGETEKAFEHLRAHLQAREKFLGRERSMRLAYLQVEFDSQLDRQQIVLLEESARVAELEAEAIREQQRARTLGLVLALVLLLLISGWLVRTLRARGHYREMSRQDRLSGLANHAWFYERAGELLESADSGRKGAFLILGDIDHFKAINDRFGHLTGDQVLGQTARRLKESFGDDALVGRVGGEEFSVLVCGWELESVIEGIQRFQTEIRERIREGDPVVTLSFGVAAYRQGDSLTDLRERADAALYRAKETGRDRYVIDAPDDPGQPDQ